MSERALGNEEIFAPIFAPKYGNIDWCWCICWRLYCLLKCSTITSWTYVFRLERCDVAPFAVSHVFIARTIFVAGSGCWQFAYCPDPCQKAGVLFESNHGCLFGCLDHDPNDTIAGSTHHTSDFFGHRPYTAAA